MRKRLQNYLDYMEGITKKDLSEEDKSRLLEEYLIQLGFFQHERLIHLLVTLAFALLGLISLLINFEIRSVILLIFTIGVLVMLYFYVNHYFFLERGVQKLYTYYDWLTKYNNFTRD